ncbi:MAG: molybdopterin-dependent oxidoreductase [Pseudomonadota bacterium]|nr:molybdopterin-dependent oxidoreductase [Pseudomonadota bacterium]
MRVITTCLRAAVLTAVTTLFALPVVAADMLDKPEGRVILEVSGKVERTTDGTVAEFDREGVIALGAETFETTTPWTEGPVTFTGVPIQALIDAVGATGETLTVTALNDYSSQMRIDTVIAAGAILAYDMNGRPLSVREKGPLWVVFPFDSNEALRTEEYWGYAVWQVKSIDIE